MEGHFGQRTRARILTYLPLARSPSSWPWEHAGQHAARLCVPSFHNEPGAKFLKKAAKIIQEEVTEASKKKKFKTRNLFFAADDDDPAKSCDDVLLALPLNKK